MQRRHVHRLIAACAAATALPFTGAARAQAWPTRPLRLVVPFPAGGATDIVGRLFAQKLSAALGQQVVVDNKPGAGGTLGADIVAKAAPDGHTLLLSTSSTHSIAPALSPGKQPYDAFKDFAPVALVATAPSVLVVGKDFPAATAQELVQLLKRSPGRYNFGSSGIGTYPHLSAEMFKWRAGGLFVVHIPYRGTGLVITDLVAGQIAFLMDSIVSAQPHIRDGKVRALAVTGARRSPSLPQVPTMAEVGVPNLVLSNWFGFFVPPGTPADVVQRLNRELNAIVQTAEIAERLQNVGAEAGGGTPEQFGRVIRDEYENWKALIARANIKPE
ncbi:MAG: tripartite tricarboxylate transporter substrate binding protein [Rubrivivax sp.]|nr:tripartite tricarboxylate transporter substrate binding protein [Rubrivivax sp.]